MRNSIDYSNMEYKIRTYCIYRIIVKFCSLSLFLWLLHRAVLIIKRAAKIFQAYPYVGVLINILSYISFINYLWNLFSWNFSVQTDTPQCFATVITTIQLLKWTLTIFYFLSFSFKRVCFLSSPGIFKLFLTPTTSWVL